MGELRDRPDEPDPEDRPERGDGAERRHEAFEERGPAWDDPQLRHGDFALSADERSELDARRPEPRRFRDAEGDESAADRPGSNPDYGTPEDAAPRPESDTPRAEPDEPDVRRARESADGEAADAESLRAPDRPAPQPETQPESEAAAVDAVGRPRYEESEWFGEKFAELQRSPFEMDRREAGTDYIDLGDGVRLTVHRDYSDPETADVPLTLPGPTDIPNLDTLPDKPPEGDELFDMESEDKPRLERVRLQAYKRADDNLDALSQHADYMYNAIHRPPEQLGHAMPKTPGPVIDQQHNGVKVGDAVAAVALTVAMMLEVGAWTLRHWRGFRRGHSDAGNG